MAGCAAFGTTAAPPGGGTDGGADGAAEAGADGTAGGPRTIACTDQPACMGNQVCCVIHGQAADVCSPSAASGICASFDGGTASDFVECDDRSDCELGSVCCGQGQADVERAQCKQQAACTTFELCDAHRDALAQGCPNRCEQFAIPSPYARCQ